MSNDSLGAPGGAEPSAPGGDQTDREPHARRKAVELLLCAAKPSLIAVGSNMVTEDSRKADREAQIGLAWAMVYPADALHAGAAFGRGDEA